VIDFPASPANGQVFASGALSWRFDGTKWVAQGAPALAVAGSSGDIQTNNGSGGLGALTPAAGVAAWIAVPSSANLRTAMTDEVGTGPAYFQGGALGTPASGSAANLTGQKFEFEVAASDETTALTTGTAKITFYMPAAITLTELFTGLSGQSSSGVVTADVKKAGATIFSTLPSIGASQDTSLAGSGSVAAVLSTTSFAKGDKMTIDFTAAGTGAKGMKVVMIGAYT